MRGSLNVRSDAGDTLPEPLEPCSAGSIYVSRNRPRMPRAIAILVRRGSRPLEISSLTSRSHRPIRRSYLVRAVPDYVIQTATDRPVAPGWLSALEAYEAALMAGDWGFNHTDRN